MTVRGRAHSAPRESLHEWFVEFAASAIGDMLYKGLGWPLHINFSNA